MFKFWNDLYRAETHLKSTKKGATSTFNPSINQLSFSWSILNICKGSYHGIELNWGYLGFGASLYSGSSQCLLTVRVLTKGSHPDSHSKLWITSKMVLGQFCYSYFCALSLWQSVLSLPARMKKINYNSMQKNYAQAQMWTEQTWGERARIGHLGPDRLGNRRHPKMVRKLVFTNSFFVRGSRLVWPRSDL